MKLPGILRGVEEEHLNFLELVDTKYPLIIPAMCPCFLPKTRTDPCVAQWQVRLIDNIIVMKRQESVFSGRNQVQIFPLDLVDHIFKVCERNCPGNNVAPEEVWRLVELEAFFRNKI